MQNPEEKFTQRAATIQGLRDLCDFLESHELAPLPFVTHLNAFPDDDADLRAIARNIGSAKKQVNDCWFHFVKKFGPVDYQITIERGKVCTSKVVGTRVVPARPERTEDIVEWDCGSLLEDKTT